MVDSQDRSTRKRKFAIIVLLLACAFVAITDPFDFLIELPWLISDLRDLRSSMD